LAFRSYGFHVCTILRQTYDVSCKSIEPSWNSELWNWNCCKVKARYSRTLHRLATEFAHFADDGTNIMIDNGWMEEPPHAMIGKPYQGIYRRLTLSGLFFSLLMD
jgi:hypothetical protein